MSPAFANHSSVIALPVPVLGNPPPTPMAADTIPGPGSKAELALPPPLHPRWWVNKGLSPQDSASATLLQIIKSLKSNI